MDKKITFESLPQVVGDLFELVVQINSKLKGVTTSSNDELMTLEDVAILFNVTLPTVHSYVKKGILVKYKLGTKSFFKKDEVLSTLFNSKSVA